MFKRNPHVRWLAVFAISLCSFAFAQQNLNNNAPATSSDEPELRRLIASFYDLYAKKEAEALTALFSPQSPILASRREMWKRLFQLENYQFSPPAISRIRFQGTMGFARVAVERTTTGVQNNQVRKTDVRADLT